METKRCPRCHKLHRASTKVCSRCGVPLVRKYTTLDTDEQTRPTLPPASPHRAGHYSGLHPEDQPYQSTKIAVRRASLTDRRRDGLPRPEPEHIQLPDPLHEAETEQQVTYPARQRVQSDPLSGWQPPSGLRLPRRIVPILLALSCLFFLLASGVLTLVLIGKNASIARAAVIASPGSGLRAHDFFTLSGHGFGARSLVTFTYDDNKKIFNAQGQPLLAHTDNNGSFSVRIQVPDTWEPGTHTVHVTDEAQKMSVSTRVNVQQSASGSPRLRLSTTSSSFAADAPGVVSSKTISLINDGGGQVSWKAASDQQVWLAVSPTSGTFAGRQDVQLTVNRAALAAGSYTGHLTFSSDAGSSPLTLTVTMGVSTGSAAISVSTTSLDFAATTVQNPPDQFITLRNNSAQALDWNSSASTGDGSSWLLITPARGHLEAGASVDVQVSVLSQQLPAGTYQAAINFGGGANARVLVNCMVQAAANLIASPTALSFALTAGKQTDSQSLTLRNNGDLDMSWSGSAATDDQGRWLTLNPPAGQLPAGAQATVKVTVAGSTLKPGMHHGMLTFSSSGIRSQVAISLSMIESMMSVPTTPLTFSSFVGKTPAARSLTLTNSGNAPLNWKTSTDNTIVSVTPALGSLSAGSRMPLTVTPRATNVGTFATTITISDNSTGQQKKIPVTVTVKDQADISVSQDSMSFVNHDEYQSTTQILIIDNDGSRPLNWTISTDTNASWLWISTPTGAMNGTMASGDSAVVSVTCNSSNLSPGTYTVTLTIRDSNPAVPPRHVAVKLVVQ